MKRRTTITLTIAGLAAMAGIVYAASPSNFSTFQELTSVAASKTELFTAGYVGNNGVYTLDCSGIPTLYQASADAEKYIAIAPAQSQNAGFTPRDVFVTYGSFIFRATPPGLFTFFAQIDPCSTGDHTGITFDKVGTFGNDMLVTCHDGGIFRIHGDGTSTLIASTGTSAEGPAVAPLSFGTFGGQLLVADDDIGAIDAIQNTNPPGPGPYVVSHNIFNYPSGTEGTPEALAFVPDQPLCTYCGFAFFQTSQQSSPGFPSLFAYPASDFMSIPSGSLIITLEQDQRILVVQNLAGNYSTTIFDQPPGYNILEGAAFVDCDIPTPTPTSTPTATFTPTATATFTPTATATFTPTATATFTPTATATFTPTATATFTPTATATFTPTATATFTPTATATFTPTATATFTPAPTPTPTATPVQVSKITPTGTTCTQFKNGTADTLSSLGYSVKNGQINQVNPGVFFYWVKVTVPAGNNSFTITETITTGNFSTPFALANGGNNVFDLNCNALSETITQDPTTGTVTVTFNAATAGTYIISLKYDGGSVKSAAAPSPTTVHYNFNTTGVPGSTSGLDLIKN